MRPTRNTDDETTLQPVDRGTRILLAEDDASLRELISCVLRLDGHDVEAVSSAQEMQSVLVAGAAAAADRPFDVIVTDVRMPGRSGLDVVEELRAAGCATPIIVITAFPDDAIKERALSLQTMLIAKPFSLEAMSFAIDWMVDVDGPESRWAH
ncbi:MAG: response regulator [Labilithrix sp.]|nr:response regulator [Labilithrix sp.]